MDSPIKQYLEIAHPKLTNEQKISTQQAMSVVMSYSGEEFEEFILEWLKYCRKSLNSNTIIGRVGGTGDNGVDIYQNDNGQIVYYQCKRYSTTLNATQLELAVTKILWHAFKNHIQVPNKIYIIAAKGMNNKAFNLITNKQQLKCDIINEMDVLLGKLNIKEDKGDFVNYLENIKNFNFIEKIDLNDIVKEYCLSDCVIFRFIAARSFKIERVRVPKVDYDQEQFVTQLREIVTRRKNQVILRAKEQFYSAICLRETDSFLYGTNEEFNKLYKEVESNIETIRNKHFEDMYERYNSIIDRAILTDASNTALQYDLHLICADDKAGICQLMVNDGVMSWGEEDE